MDDLYELKLWLLERLESPTQFTFVNTRLILRTGVDLAKVEEPTLDPRAAEVVNALGSMGFNPTSKA